MSALDGIKARAKAYTEHGTPGLHAPQDRAKLLAAVTAVAEVHQWMDAVMYSGPQQRMVRVCTGCGTDDGNWQRWPCATVAAITRALETPGE
jgi:hypothetical protein